MKYSKTNIREMGRVLRAYESLMRDPRNEIDKWEEVWEMENRHLCESVNGDCDRCLLYRLESTNNISCYNSHNYHNDLQNTMDNYFDGELALNRMVEKVILRYDQIIKHLNSLDYYWESR